MPKIFIMIQYFYEDTDFVFRGKTLNSKWLRLVAESEIKRIGSISVIFCITYFK